MGRRSTSLSYPPLGGAAGTSSYATRSGRGSPGGRRPARPRLTVTAIVGTRRDVATSTRRTADALEAVQRLFASLPVGADHAWTLLYLSSAIRAREVTASTQDRSSWLRLSLANPRRSSDSRSALLLGLWLERKSRQSAYWRSHRPSHTRWTEHSGERSRPLPQLQLRPGGWGCLENAGSRDPAPSSSRNTLGRSARKKIAAPTEVLAQHAHGPRSERRRRSRGVMRVRRSVGC